MGKRKQRTTEEQAIFERIKGLTQQLKTLEPDVLKRASDLLGWNISIQSLHGKIGGKNNIFADVAYSQYSDYRYFQDCWTKGLYEKNKYQIMFDSNNLPDVVTLYLDEFIREYIKLFQERNFYKHYEERIRMKPDSHLWELWFGQTITWGLIISPIFSNGKYCGIDHSEIRRTPYKYWTIGHVLNVGGFVNGENNDLYKIADIDALLNFYNNVIYSMSSSQYEKKIYELYIEYLRNSSNVYDEPFLIPELRYAGKAAKHEYRLDFTILNEHTHEFIGYELSPASTHMQIVNLKQRTQSDVNAELKEKWGNECEKRNAYFSKFGIHVISFADKDLENIPECFDKIRPNLENRKNEVPSMEETIRVMKQYIK